MDVIADVTLAGTIAIALAVVALSGFVLNLFDRARKSERRMARLETMLEDHITRHDLR